MTDDAARTAERQRSFFMECLALATHQYGMSASPSDTVAAAVTYFNALNGIAAQCSPGHEGASKGNGPGLSDAITGVRLSDSAALHERLVPRFDPLAEPGPL